jgi:hypothetical protein
MKLMATLFSLVLVFLLSLRPVFAAEIININYKYKIAFTDLTENDVKAGDLVYVVMPDGKDVPMKVLETFPVMVKLTFSDGPGALTEEQFNGITVGSSVKTMEGAASRSGKMVKASRGPANEEKTGSIETYSPPAIVMTAPVKEAPVVKAVVPSPVPVEAPAVVSSAKGDRSVVQEQRLDQMMLNNVKLAESVTQLLTEKNAAEALARDKEAEAAAARKKANELAAVNDDLSRRVQALEASGAKLLTEKSAAEVSARDNETAAVAARKKADELVVINDDLSRRVKTLEEGAALLEQNKAGQQKEIESLTNKIGELKKKLSKMVDIINTNMKAYEKQ